MSKVFFFVFLVFRWNKHLKLLKLLISQRNNTKSKEGVETMQIVMQYLGAFPWWKKDIVARKNAFAFAFNLIYH